MRKTDHTYPRCHLLPPLVMLAVVRLAKDVVPPVLEPAGMVIPVGALVARLGVDVDPDIGRRGDEHLGRDASNGAWREPNKGASGDKRQEEKERVPHHASRSPRRTTRGCGAAAWPGCEASRTSRPRPDPRSVSGAHRRRPWPRATGMRGRRAAAPRAPRRARRDALTRTGRW